MVSRAHAASAGRRGRAPAGYQGIVLAAPFSLVPAKTTDKSTTRLLAEVLSGVLGKAGMRPDDLDGLSLSALTLSPDGAPAFAHHLGLTFRYLDEVAMGGASAIASVRRAARMVAAGDVRAVAVIGADSFRDTSFGDLVANFSRFSRDHIAPLGAGGPNAAFALITDRYMRTFGATREDFGRLAVAQRQNAQGVPHAVFGGRPLTMEEYLSARPIAEPLHLYDCVMPVAGGEGCLVMREEDAEAAGLPFARIAATLECHNAFPDDPVALSGGWSVEAPAFWARAGLSPHEVDCAQTYDDYPVMSFIQLEALGFCAKGEAASFVRSHDLTRLGSFPHNTCGGQLSAGQAGAAGGHLGLVEALRQVTGEADGWQLASARRALVSGYGMAVYDRGVCATALLMETGRRRELRSKR